RDQWHSMTKTGKVARLQSHYPEPKIEINPVDAYIHHIKQGDICEVKSRNGNIRLKAMLTDSVREGVLFAPMHWGKILQSDLGRANNLTNTIVDPQSKEPDFKFTAVSISKYKKQEEKIVIIGAGAAAFRFIQNYRDLNTTDRIEVFSLEPYPFYNRVLLPEYITEELSWEQLQKIKQDELHKLKIKIHHHSKIIAIDRVNKTIIDDSQQQYSYDKLILATGSSPFIPSDVQIDLPGRFTMRTKGDADRFKEHLNKIELPTPQKHVVIVGGGLLGLEL